MKYRNLRDFITFLESKGELRRIATPVTWDLEITEICDRVTKSGGPALLFENVEGYDVSGADQHVWLGASDGVGAGR